MKLDLDQSAGNYARSFSPGELRINNKVFNTPVILTSDNILEWSPPPIAAMTAADFEQILLMKPELILLGTGRKQEIPQNELIITVMQQGIGFEFMDTAAACRTYNLLAGEYRNVVAALLVN